MKTSPLPGKANIWRIHVLASYDFWAARSLFDATPTVTLGLDFFFFLQYNPTLCFICGHF